MIAFVAFTFGIEAAVFLTGGFLTVALFMMGFVVFLAGDDLVARVELLVALGILISFCSLSCLYLIKNLKDLSAYKA